jgi:hypothetical protein
LKGKFVIRLFTAALLLYAFAAPAADVTVKIADKEPPKDVSDAIRGLLRAKVIQVGSGDKPAYEFWLVKELPLQSKPASVPKALDSVKQATLLGVVAVPAARRDYRDDELAPAVYTMRFALQPQDGNHSGSAEFPYFAVLVPAKLDTKPDGIKDYKELVKTSSKETSTDHPVVMSLWPASSAEGDAPKLNQPAAEHKSVRVKVPAKGDSTPVAFEIVVEGKAHK